MNADMSGEAERAAGCSDESICACASTSDLICTSSLERSSESYVRIYSSISSEPVRGTLRSIHTSDPSAHFAGLRKRVSQLAPPGPGRIRRVPFRRIEDGVADDHETVSHDVEKHGHQELHDQAPRDRKGSADRDGKVSRDAERQKARLLLQVNQVARHQKSADRQGDEDQESDPAPDGIDGFLLRLLEREATHGDLRWMSQPEDCPALANAARIL